MGDSSIIGFNVYDYWTWMALAVHCDVHERSLNYNSYTLVDSRFYLGSISEL